MPTLSASNVEIEIPSQIREGVPAPAPISLCASGSILPMIALDFSWMVCVSQYTTSGHCDPVRLRRVLHMGAVDYKLKDELLNNKGGS
jgi:hypothetical protein